MLLLNAALRVKPEVFVGFAAQKFDAQGLGTHAATRSFVPAQMAAQMAALVRHVPRQKRRLALDRAGGAKARFNRGWGRRCRPG